MMPQQLKFLFLVPIFLFLVAKANGSSLLPFIDTPSTLLSDLWSDRFSDPFRVLEQIPFGVDKDEAATAMSPARVDWKEMLVK